MKTLINILIVAMFGIEICSPFFIGYLNHKERTRKKYSQQEAQNIAMKEKQVLNKEFRSWKSIDFTGNNYSDSKTYTVKE